MVSRQNSRTSSMEMEDDTVTRFTRVSGYGMKPNNKTRHWISDIVHNIVNLLLYVCLVQCCVLTHAQPHCCRSVTFTQMVIFCSVRKLRFNFTQLALSVHVLFWERVVGLIGLKRAIKYNPWFRVMQAVIGWQGFLLTWCFSWAARLQYVPEWFPSLSNLI